LWLIDPVICLAAVLAISPFFRALRARGAHATLAAAWMVAVLLTLAGFQYRAAWYLLPLAAALTFGAGQYAIGIGNRLGVVILVLACAAKIMLPDRLFGLPYTAQSIIPAARTLEGYCRSGNAAPLFLLQPKDQFYATDLALPKIHYVFLDPTQHTEHAAMDFGYLGITVTVEEFLKLETLRPVFRERLRSWGLDSDDAIATVILARSRSEILELESRGAGNFLDTATGRTMNGLRFVDGSKVAGPCRF
jgi:hypothetical protein